MATIRKRTWRSGGEPRTAWLVDYRDQHGERRFKQFARKRDADAWLVEARHEVASGTHTPDSASATVAEAAELWLERCEAEGLEPLTVAQYRQHARHILALIDGRLKLAKLTKARVEQLRDDLLKHHSRSMARKVLVSFKSALRDARRRNLIAADPARDTRIGGDGRHKRRLQVGVDVPAPAEVRALLDGAPPKARALVALAALAGLRASEIRALPWSDVDLGQEPAVTVRRRADARGVVGSPKSAASRRIVPLGETATLALKEWRVAQPGGRELVCGTSTDKPDMLSNLQRRLLAPLCAAAAVRRYSWHALRHYAVSSWLASGIDPKTAQTWAGHGTLSMTLDIYGHFIPRPDDRARIAAAEAVLAT